MEVEVDTTVMAMVAAHTTAMAVGMHTAIINREK